MKSIGTMVAIGWCGVQTDAGTLTLRRGAGRRPIVPIGYSGKSANIYFDKVYTHGIDFCSVMLPYTTVSRAPLIHIPKPLPNLTQAESSGHTSLQLSWTFCTAAFVSGSRLSSSALVIEVKYVPKRVLAFSNPALYMPSNHFWWAVLKSRPSGL